MIIIIFSASILTIVQAQWTIKWDEWDANKSKPIDLLNRVHYEANDEAGSAVEITPLNKVSGKNNGSHCDIAVADDRFTLTKTFCSIKYFIRWYLQYIMYIWLAGATIFIIRNWFLIVTAADKEKQMWTFKKNMKNLIIWVILLTSFYFILDVFVSVINFVVGD